MTNDSVKIILNQYKQKHITEDEAIQLIEDLYRYKYTYTPIFSSWPQITYGTQQFPKYEITCKKE